MRIHRCSTLIAILACTAPLQAGLHYSAEVQAELPSQWRGLLLDLRALRTIGVNAPNPSLLREQYQEAAAKLQKLSRLRELTADELADLGALHVRLNQPDKAVDLLLPGTRKHPEHFRIMANLGTALQMTGELNRAAEVLQDAVRLAPAQWKALEEAHYRLVRGRAREAVGKNRESTLDDLFGVKFQGESDKPEPGKIAVAQRKKLPADDAAIVQQLLLWLPSDGRLLWQLGEIANAHGDVRTAGNILDGCVIEFRLASADLRERRAVYLKAAEAIALLPDSEHEKYRGDLKMKSRRPLEKKLDSSILPPIRADGVNTLPWLVLEETAVARPFKPRFAKYLEDLEGKRIALTGFMQPLGAEVADASAFLLIEFPVGCWFCEAPETAGIIYVGMPDGKNVSIRKGIVKVEGALRLNRSDPEQYLYSIKDARVSDPD
jgi:hypothetical protein